MIIMMAWHGNHDSRVTPGRSLSPGLTAASESPGREGHGSESDSAGRDGPARGLPARRADSESGRESSSTGRLTRIMGSGPPAYPSSETDSDSARAVTLA